jgi:hypothetical protein
MKSNKTPEVWKKFRGNPKMIVENRLMSATNFTLSNDAAEKPLQWELSHLPIVASTLRIGAIA